MWLHGLVAVVAWAGVALAGSASAADTDRPLRLHYNVYSGGLNAMSGSLAVDLKPDRYAIELAAETKGTIGLIFPWRSVMRTQGRADSSALKPRAHEFTSVARGEPSGIALDYDEAGRFAGRRTTGPEPEEGLEPVSLPLAEGAVDILTATLDLMRHLRSGRSCNQTIPVFDGRRRYDFISAGQGAEMVQRSSYSSFAGQAVKCSIAIRPTGGAWKKRQRRWVDPAKAGDPQPLFASVWFAAPAATVSLPAPVKIQVATPFGEFTAYLSHLE